MKRFHFHFENGTVESLLNIIIRRYAEYSLESGGDYYYVSRISSNRNGVNQYGGNYFTVQDDLFSADLKKVRFLDVLADLMNKGGHEYSVLGQNDSIIERFSFRDKTFSEILDLLLEQANSGYEISNGIYYFFDKDRQDILNKFVSTIRIPLIRNSADSIVSLIPDYLIGEAVIKKDPLANNIIISGPVASLVPLESYILGLENDLPGYAWNRFDLNFLESGEIASFLPETYSSHKSINLEESNAFLMYMSVEKVNALRDFLNLIDIPVKVTPVYLNYITAENLMNNLPPSIDEVRVSVSSDPNLVFFRGNVVQLDHFKDSIAAMDRPIPQIRYDVLVLQVQDTNQLDWESSLSNEILSDDSQTAITGSLGRILSLNFDIVSQFGYLFAAKLNTALDKSEARVMADTTLYALSGESIEFKNTGTSRYYEAEYNSEGELQDYGTINEISSGLIIEIEGWVSGDGMITMTVGSTISKENTVDSTSTYALPSTTEKIVSTSVRTPSGQPIIITGLKQQDTSYSISKVPFLGDIPLLGLLFQKRQEIIEDTDFYITIVPHLEYTGREAESNRYEDIYRRLVTGL